MYYEFSSKFGELINKMRRAHLVSKLEGTNLLGRCKAKDPLPRRNKFSFKYFMIRSFKDT